MTAINIQVTHEKATVWADGLLYLPDGTIFGLTHKARRLEGWCGVLLSTGLHQAGNELAEILPMRAATFDEFLDNRDAILREAMEEVQPLLDRAGKARFAAFIVGWSDRRSVPEMVVYNDMDGTGAGEIGTSREIISPQLFELEMQEVILGCREIAQRTGKMPNFSDAARLTMEVQRRHRANPDYASDGYYVGGHITETVIDANGIREQVIHRWNDTIGEKVNPFADFPENVAPLTGSNRAERRRAERVAKKNGRAA